MLLSGCATALVTPFKKDGSLDLKALTSLVEWQIESGIDFLVMCGTTGEAPTLEEEEWLDVVTAAIEAGRGRIPILAGCTHNSTHEAVRKAQRAAEIRGLDGLLSANPYYNRPTQEGQFQHFLAMAESTPLPLVLYNIPGRTGANLEPKTIARLAEAAPTLAGVKESSGNLQQITELLHLVPAGLPVFAGDDNIALPAIGAGAAGLISVAANEIPSQMGEMVRAALADDWERAREINRSYYGLMLANFLETNPGPVKCLLAMMGKMEEIYRLPMVAVSNATRDRIRALAADLELLA